MFAPGLLLLMQVAVKGFSPQDSSSVSRSLFDGLQHRYCGAGDTCGGGYLSVVYAAHEAQTASLVWCMLRMRHRLPAEHSVMCLARIVKLCSTFVPICMHSLVACVC
jgi:hypothetical protein